jgi:hypothetical protein
VIDEAHVEFFVTFIPHDNRFPEIVIKSYLHIFLLKMYFIYNRNLDNIVDIATGYGLDDRRIGVGAPVM